MYDIILSQLKKKKKHTKRYSIKSWSTSSNDKSWSVLDLYPTVLYTSQINNKLSLSLPYRLVPGTFPSLSHFHISPQFPYILILIPQLPLCFLHFLTSLAHSIVWALPYFPLITLRTRGTNCLLQPVSTDHLASMHRSIHWLTSETEAPWLNSPKKKRCELAWDFISPSQRLIFVKF